MESVCVESDLGEEPDLRAGYTDNSEDKGLFLLLPFSRTSVPFYLYVSASLRVSGGTFSSRISIGHRLSSVRRGVAANPSLRVFCRQSFLRMLSRSQSHSGIIFQKNTMTA